MQFHSHIRLAVLVVMSGLMSSCASLSEKQCKRADWSGIGYRDGANGQTEFRVNDHKEACAKYGVQLDGKLYEQGRQRGLVQYCTIQGGLRTGRDGNAYNGVCDGPEEAAFLRAYRLGLDLNRMEAKLESLREEQRSIRYRLQELDEQQRKASSDSKDRNKESDGDRDRRRRERDSLLLRLRELERDLWQMEIDFRSLELETFRLR